MPDEPLPEVETGPGWHGALGLAGLTVLGIASAALELLWIPLYAGTVPIPLAVVGAVGGNVLLPYLARVLGFGGRLAGLPFYGWLLVMLFAVLLPRPEGDVVVPGGSLTWVTYGVLFGGAIAGTLTIVITTTPRMRTLDGAPPPPAPRPASRPRPKR